MKKILLFIVSLSLICVGGYTNAETSSELINDTPVWTQNQPTNDYNSIVSAFKSIKEITVTGIKVPTVVESMFVSTSNERKDAVVFDSTDKVFIPSYLISAPIKGLSGYTVSANGIVRNEIKDELYDSCVDFNLSNESKVNSISLEFNYDKEITSDAFYLSLDNYVTLPVSLGIKAVVDGIKIDVLAPVKLTDSNVTFPKTSSRNWTVEMSYVQPLRICEASFNQKDTTQYRSYSVRFLAKNDHQYQIYFNGDRSVNVYYAESGNLTNDLGVLKLTSGEVKINSAFKLSDVDKDNIPDIKDNCVSISNSDQVDVDMNGRGDVCDDFDRDGIINLKDNCKDIPNENQNDTDSDGVGDKCDNTEGRLTEKLPWLPWFGIGFAAVLILGLMYFTVKRPLPSNEIK